MTEDLYSVSDVKRVRELLLKEQGGLDLLTKLEIPCKMAVLDHKHDINQFVRGVLHRQCNVVLGKIGKFMGAGIFSTGIRIIFKHF